MTSTRTFRSLAFAAVAAVAASGLALVGCGAQPGDTLVKYERSDTGDKLTQAPGSGEVRLYGSNDAANQVRYNVSRGDEVGFRDQRTESGGRVVAVAGENEQAINQGRVLDRTYYWKFKKSK